MPESHPGAEAIGDHTNPEKYRGDHHWDFTEMDCCASAVVPAQCLSCVPDSHQLRVRELTVFNKSTQSVEVHMVVSACAGAPAAVAAQDGRVKLPLALNPQTQRQWSSQDGRRFHRLQRPCFYVTPSCAPASCVSITGAGLLELAGS